MNKIVIILLGLISSTYANDSNKNVRIYDEFYQIQKSKNGLYELSRPCFTQRNCDAAKAIREVQNWKNKKFNTRGGKQLGALLCMELEGKTVEGRRKKSKRLFCYFKDKSVTPVSSLTNVWLYKKGTK